VSESEGEQKDQRQPEVRGEEKYGFSQLRQERGRAQCLKD